jgi:hypothetical protein
MAKGKCEDCAHSDTEPTKDYELYCMFGRPEFKAEEKVNCLCFETLEDIAKDKHYR